MSESTPEMIEAATLGPRVPRGTVMNVDNIDLLGLTYEQRCALPPALHQPVWDGLAQPSAWICAVCWDDGLTTSWPCDVARKHGAEVAKAGGLEWHT